MERTFGWLTQSLLFALLALLIVACSGQATPVATPTLPTEPAFFFFFTDP
jgi:hypothetical protein